jgi:hypothetical protein
VKGFVFNDELYIVPDETVGEGVEEAEAAEKKDSPCADPEG